MPYPRLQLKKPNGEVEWYRLAVFQIEGRYDERPKVGDRFVPAECRFCPDDLKIQIEGGEGFFTAFVPESVFGPGQ